MEFITEPTAEVREKDSSDFVKDHLKNVLEKKEKRLTQLKIDEIY